MRYIMKKPFADEWASSDERDPQMKRPMEERGLDFRSVKGTEYVGMV